MKKITYLIIAVFLLTSCEKVIEKQALDAVDNNIVFSNTEVATLYLNKLYSYVLPEFNATENTDLSDESTGSGTDDMMYGALETSSSYGNYNTTSFNHIRSINILLSEIDNGSIPLKERAIIKGQAYFLRAWKYWEMVKLYGGIPMIMESLEPSSSENLWVSRDPASKCIDLIVQDLDSAISNLPLIWNIKTDFGRVTSASAAALKGRVLLFYASPQFNPDNLETRWLNAYEANIEAKTLCNDGGYALHSNFDKIFINEANSEALFVTCYDGFNKFHGYENSVRPGYFNSSKTSSSNPTWEMVKAFPMADGSNPGKSSTYTYDSLYFWKNRDPRFYATIAYNGCEWSLGNQKIQWNYEGSLTESVSRTTTGFYCKKNINTEIEDVNTPNTPTDWIEIRYAEVLLNLAECAAELNKLDEARTELYAIRDRAGIEDGDGSYGITATTKEQMVEAVMLERQIEFAFEDKRHWDLRRRNLFTDKLNGTRRTGIITTLVMPDTVTSGNENKYIDFFNSFIVDTINLENDYYTYFNTEFGIEMDGTDINFPQPKYNFYYIPQSSLDRNPNLQQTIYWGDLNPFDPLVE